VLKKALCKPELKGIRPIFVGYHIFKSLEKATFAIMATEVPHLIQKRIHQIDFKDSTFNVAPVYRLVS
jgi:hypothetical protein